MLLYPLLRLQNKDWNTFKSIFMVRILIGDDHAVIRKGLRQILLERYPSAIIEEANDAEGLISKAIAGKFDVIISDLSMPGRSGLDVLSYIKQNFPDLPVLILSSYPEDQYAIRTLKAGASGYLSKETAPEELVKAVERVLQGRKYISSSIAEKMAENLEQGGERKTGYESLSDREFDVFKLIAAGKPVSEIAEQLSLSVTTVSTYRARILVKMGMKTNAEITMYCLQNNLI